MKLFEIYPNEEDIQEYHLLYDCDPALAERHISDERKFVEILTQLIPEISEIDIDFNVQFCGSQNKTITISLPSEELKLRAMKICSLIQFQFFRDKNIFFNFIS